MKKGAIDYIKFGFKALYKNPILLVPTLLNLLVIMVGIFLWTFLKEFLGTVSLMIVTSLLLAVVIFSVFYFGLGLIGMAKEVIDKKKPKMSNLVSYWKKFWGKYVLVNVLMMLILLGIGLVGLILFGLVIWILYLLNVTGDPLTVWSMFSGLIIGTAAFLISLLFFLAPYILLLENKTPKKALIKSLKVVKENYGNYLLILISFILISVLINAIPLPELLDTSLEWLVSIILGAAQALAYMGFAYDRR